MMMSESNLGRFFQQRKVMSEDRARDIPELCQNAEGQSTKESEDNRRNT